MADGHKNFAYSTVATAPSPASSGTSLVVAAGGGALFPTSPFNVTIWPAGAQPLASNAEVARCTAISTDTFTIARAQEGSSARTVVVGDQIAAAITTKTLTDVENAVWAASTLYQSGQLIVNAGILYQATATFTSPGSFTTANLSQVAVAPGAVILTGSVPYSQPGSAVTGTSGSWTAPSAGTVVACRLSCVGAPVGSGLVVGFKHNGAAAFSTLTVPAGSTTVSPSAPAEAFSAGDTFQVNATSVGSTTAATGVVAQIDYTQVIA